MPFKVVQGHRFWYQSKAHMRATLPLVIDTNLPAILHRFQDIVFDRSKIAIFYYPACLTPPTERFSWDELRKIFRECQRMARVPNAVEILRKITTA